MDFLDSFPYRSFDQGFIQSAYCYLKFYQTVADDILKNFEQSDDGRFADPLGLETGMRSYRYLTRPN